MPNRQSFFKTLKGYESFTKVLSLGKKFEESPLKAFICVSSLPKTSFLVGYTVSKSIRKSVCRNRAKRIMKEAFKLCASKINIEKFRGREVKIVFLYANNAVRSSGLIKLSSVKNSMEKIIDLVNCMDI